MFLLMCRRGDAQLRQKRACIFFLAQCFVSLRFQKRDLAAVAGDFYFELCALFLELLNLCVCRCDLSLEGCAFEFERLQFALRGMLFAFQFRNFRD